jgi:hypothetical protein
MPGLCDVIKEPTVTPFDLITVYVQIVLCLDKTSPERPTGLEHHDAAQRLIPKCVSLFAAAALL